MAESVESFVIWCKFLCIIAVNSVPMSENGITMGRIFFSVCAVCWSNRWLWSWVKAFFMFLMIRCNGYAQTSRMHVRLLSSSCRIWSSEMIML